MQNLLGRATEPHGERETGDDAAEKQPGTLRRQERGEPEQADCGPERSRSHRDPPGSKALGDPKNKAVLKVHLGCLSSDVLQIQIPVPPEIE